MRTKALLLAAAFAAAGAATSMAQVYSVNAVGYVNVTLPSGFSMVSNPLDAGAGNNTVKKLFSNIAGGVPNNSRVYLFSNATGAYTTVTYNSILGGWNGPAGSADSEINPGSGAFFQNTTANPLTLTFVGEVKQGANLSNPIKVGFNIIANQVPQAGKLDAFANSTFPGNNGDRVYRFNPSTGAYQTFTFNSILGGWSPALPSINVGESFFYFRGGANGDTAWTRSFNVNNPA